MHFTLCCLLLMTADSTLIAAQTKKDNNEAAISKIKDGITERGTGEKKRVNVKLRNGDKLKGYISQSGEDSFMLTDSKTGQATSIAYRDVAKVNSRLSKGEKIAVGIALGAAATVAIIVISFFSIYCHNEGC